MEIVDFRYARYYRNAGNWVEADVYLYGTLIDAGGKDKSNIHLQTESGVYVIAAEKDTLKNEERNLLYKDFGVRVICKQNILTGELDKSSLSLVEIIDYSRQYDEDYLKSLMVKAGKTFEELDPDEFVHEIRGGYA